ncbi:hypothetical protein PVAND_016716 [Polypedilum vanderplanki]|uniref:Uncharacterized protein n=1 Tax=Polypedilum vanderplanki TaxID=319348 RepID=A0A9J6BH56_POLVA|nr:hypothetical protein PVAND_016716 [Polypedilum vanderplanki]
MAVKALIYFLGLSFVFSKPQMGGPIQQQFQKNEQGMQQPQMGGQGMQQPQMNGQGLQQPQMSGQGMPQPQMNGQGMQQSQMNGQGVQQSYEQQGQIEVNKVLELVQKCVNQVAQNYTRPALCCPYPVPMMDSEIASKCHKDCEDAADLDECFEMCINNRLKLYNENIEMITESWSEFFLRSFDFKNLTRGEWSNVVPESSKKCSEELLGNYNKNFPRSLLLVAIFARSCMLRQNFISCPKFRNTVDCKKTKEFLKNDKSCYVKYESLINLKMVWD